MQSTENDHNQRPDLDEIQAHIDNVLDAIPGGATRDAVARGEGADDRLRFLIQTLAALAAERDRADRAEARLADAWDEGVQKAELVYAKARLSVEHEPTPNPYRPEATA